MKLPALLLLSCGLLSLPLGAHAQAQRVNRCTNAQGQSVFTDRSCDAVDATARAPRGEPSVGNTGIYRAGCARRLSELTEQIRQAVSLQDVNRLSSIYLWGNVSNATANQIIGRLESVVRRPLVDIAPVYPSVAEPIEPLILPPDPDATAGAAGVVPVEVAPPAPSRPRPVGLRLEQTLANSATPSRTVFGLRRQYGCFWITL
ncbi:hypothetical protein [Stenotrophomonas sp. PS02289]|uniref:hypothetical protein n=1 Tax=Stenotrophomonas sp. PS02289 TaxID=2991422 RepID=UPI002499AF38|nr:hypothetical protein [Stenotrophomonas sp. PS02289]